MRAIKRILIILLAVLAAGYLFTAIYRGSPDRKVPPTIACPQETLEISAKDPRSALLQGVTATDAQDGDLTDRIIIGGVSKLISEDTAKVTLLVFDSDDNMSSCTRYIRYTDYRRPRFSVDKPLIFSTTQSASILERVSALDVVDGDLSHAIRVSTLKATDDSRLYDITVQVTNSLGDTAVLELPVLLLEADPLRPTIHLSSYLMYLESGSRFDPLSLLEGVLDPAGEADLSTVTVENGVDTTKPGTYRVTYSYVSNGRVGTAIATVVVQ